MFTVAVLQRRDYTGGTIYFLSSGNSKELSCWEYEILKERAISDINLLYRSTNTLKNGTLFFPNQTCQFLFGFSGKPAFTLHCDIL